MARAIPCVYCGTGIVRRLLAGWVHEATGRRQCARTYATPA